MNFSNIYDANKSFTIYDEFPTNTTCNNHPQLNWVLFGVRLAVPVWEALAIATGLGECKNNIPDGK